MYDKDQTRQWHDWLYRCDLCWNQNLVVMTNRTGCGLSQKADRIMTWLVIKVWSLQNMILNCKNQSDSVQFIMKTTQDNDVSDHTGVISIEYDIELSRPITLSVVYDEDEIRQQRDQLYMFALCRIWNWTVMTDLIGYSVWRRPDRTTMWLIIKV